jgi:hypothetical protein
VPKKNKNHSCCGKVAEEILALEIMLNIEGSHIDCVPTCIKF